MIKLELADVVATWSDETLACDAAYTVTYGASGNDRLSADRAEPFVVLCGGSDDDSYAMSQNATALIADCGGGHDRLEMARADFAEAARSLATIDGGRHLLLRSNDSSAIVLDWLSDANRIEQFVFGATLIDFETLRHHAMAQTTLDYRWEELFALGLTGLPKDTANSAIAALVDQAGAIERVDDVQGIARLYETAFHRKADVDGLNYWCHVYERDHDRDALARAFLTSPEFVTRLASGEGSSTRDCVDALCDSLDGTARFESTRSAMAQAIETGQLSREAALFLLSDSQESLERCGYVNDLVYSDGLWSFG